MINSPDSSLRREPKRRATVYCCSIVRSKRANTVRPYRDNPTFAIGLRDVEDAVHYDMRRKITLALAILYTREHLKCEISAFEGAKLRRRLKKSIPVCY